MARPTSRCIPLAAGIALALAGCIGNPTVDATNAEAINEIGNELSMLRDDNATLQGQVDSLRAVVARQDTILRQLANLSGVPIVR